MSDSSIPAGLSIWQVKALQEIDRLEEEKDEVLKLMAYEREQMPRIQYYNIQYSRIRHLIILRVYRTPYYGRTI